MFELVNLLDKFFLILQVIVGFGLIIFLHEFGHFLAAKLLGVRVEKFSIGFGKKLMGFTRGETEYMLSLLPLGGYVKLSGEYPEEEDLGKKLAGVGPGDVERVEHDPRALYAQPVWARAVIFSAGVLMNFVTAIPMLLLLYWVLGDHTQAPYVVSVQDGSPAAMAGLLPGDYITRVNGRRIMDSVDVEVLFRLHAADENISLQVVRHDGVKHLEIPAAAMRDRQFDSKQLGIHWWRTHSIVRVDAPSPASEAGLRAFDHVLKLNGADVQDMDIARMSAILNRTEAPVEVLVERQKSTRPGPQRFERLACTMQARERRQQVLELIFDFGPVAGNVSQRLSDGMVSPAARAGLQKGDVILALGGASMTTWSDLVQAVKRNGARRTTLDIVRGDGKIALSVTPRFDPASSRFLLGIGPDLNYWVLSQVPQRYRDRLRRGDRVSDINVLTVREIIKHQEKIAEGEYVLMKIESDAGQLRVPNPAGQPVHFRIERDHASLSLALQPETITEPYTGLEIGYARLPVILRYGFAEALALSWYRCIYYFDDLRLLANKIFVERDAKMAKQSAAGVVGIAAISYKMAEEGFAKLLKLLAALSVNLAIFNLLPIPILDGGHLLFLVLEKIKGRPVSIEARAVAQWVGLSIILGLFVMITINDIGRIKHILF